VPLVIADAFKVVSATLPVNTETSEFEATLLTAKAVAVPVMLVPIKVTGVPKFGEVKTGEVKVALVIVGLAERTRLTDPVEVETPVPPDETANGLAKVIDVLVTVIAVTLPAVWNCITPVESEVIVNAVNDVTPAIKVVAMLGS
jgi:hypothetical protein